MSKKTKAEQKPDRADGAEQATPGAMARMMIPMDLIALDPERERLADDPELDQLVASMRVDGLLQPVGVLELGRTLQVQKHRLVFGHRRFAAAKRLGWKAIEATVLALPDGFAELDVLKARAIENLQRKELNPAEEAVMVARLLASIESMAHNENTRADAPVIPAVKMLAIRIAAETLAKSETWVRDRAFIGRLDGRAHELVLSGALPLAHAREIAKMADPVARNELATRSAAGYKPLYGMARDHAVSLMDLKREVAKSLLSLAQAPWKLDVAFARAPACTECPHNSANQPGLFDGGVMASGTREEAANRHATPSVKVEPKAGVCTAPECFKEKSATANRAISNAAAKHSRSVLAEKPNDREPVTARSVAQVTPVFVEAAKVAAIAKEKVAALASSKPSGSGSASTAPKAKAKTPEQIAKDALYDAQREWTLATGTKVWERVKKHPMERLVLTLLVQSSVVNKAVRKGEGAVGAPGVLRLVGFLGEPVTIAAIEELAKGFNDDYTRDVLNDLSLDPGGAEFLRRLALQLDIDATPPKLADFMPKVPAEFVPKPIPRRPAKAATTSGKLDAVVIRTPHCGACGRDEKALKDSDTWWATDAKDICDECADTTRDREEA